VDPKASSKSGFRSNDFSAGYKYLHFIAPAEEAAADRSLAIDKSE
jgi:hypothetical protein